MNGMRILAIAAGGACGALLRAAVSGWIQQSRLGAHRLGSPVFPWGTFLVNLSGCLAIGLLVGFLERRFSLSPELQAFLLLGLLGGYTTFSTFALEAVQLLESGSPWLALTYALSSPFFGILGVLLGSGLASDLY
jgi:CrcB protein